MSTMAAIPTRTEDRMESVLAGRMDVTPEELLAMPDGEHYELVNGVPVARTMSLLSSRVEMALGGSSTPTASRTIWGGYSALRAAIAVSPGSRGRSAARTPRSSPGIGSRPKSNGRKVTSRSPPTSPWR